MPSAKPAPRGLSLRARAHPMRVCGGPCSPRRRLAQAADNRPSSAACGCARSRGLPLWQGLRVSTRGRTHSQRTAREALRSTTVLRRRPEPGFESRGPNRTRPDRRKRDVIVWPQTQPGRAAAQGLLRVRCECGQRRSQNLGPSASNQLGTQPRHCVVRFGV